MRVFAIWNQGYIKRYIIAEDQEAALRYACIANFIRRPDRFRKLNDCTEEVGAAMECLLAEQRAGFAVETEEGWSFA